MVLPANMRR